MDSIEGFLAAYPATIATVTSLATVAAVVTALYLARRQSRAHLEVFADVRRYVSSEAQAEASEIRMDEMPLMIGVTISNVGPIPVSIPYFSSFIWSVLGGKQVVAQNPKEPKFRHQPIELQPGRSASIVLSDDLDGCQQMIKSLAEASKFGNWSRRFVRLTVHTEIGDRFRAKLGKSLLNLARGV